MHRQDNISYQEPSIMEMEELERTYLAKELPKNLTAFPSQEHFAAGGMLCGKTYADVEKDLDRFRYKKVTIG